MLCLGFGLGVVLFEVIPASKGKGFWGFVRTAFALEWHLLIPLLVFGVYGITNGLKRVSSELLFQSTGQGFVLDFLHMKTIFLQVFVLNFQWVLGLIALAGICLSLLLRGRLKEKDTRLARLNPLWGVITTLLACYLLFNLLYVEIELLRYNLPIIAFLPMVCCYAAQRLALRGWVKKIGYTLLFCLLLLANYKTVDPVTRILFPYQLDVGEYSLLDMTRRDWGPHICEVHVYNRQYLDYSRLMDEIIYQHGVDESRPYASWNIPVYSLQFFGNEEYIYRLQYSPEQKRRVFYARDMVPIPGREFMYETLEQGIVPLPSSLWIAPSNTLSGEEDILETYRCRGMIVYLTTSPIPENSVVPLPVEE